MTIDAQCQPCTLVAHCLAHGKILENAMTISYFICVECKKKIVFIRKKSQQVLIETKEIKSIYEIISPLSEFEVTEFPTCYDGRIATDGGRCSPCQDKEFRRKIQRSRAEFASGKYPASPEES